MKNLPRGIAALTALVLCVPSAHADFLGLEVEVVVTDVLLDGRPCGMLRIYGRLSAPDDQLVVVYGNTGQLLELSTTDPFGFYQNPLGANLATQISSVAPSIDPFVLYDSWVTVGLDMAQSGTLLHVGIDWSAFEAGGSITTDNGTWLSLPDEPNVFPIDGRVLLAQVTCGMGSVVHGTFNLQGRSPDAADPNGFSTWDAPSLDFSVPMSTTGASTQSLSLSAGGTQQLHLAGGAAHAGQTYLVLVTGSGTAPGFPFGGALLPLNPDAFTSLGLVLVNQAPWANTLGVLDAQGTASASLTLQAGSPASLAGMTLHHTWFAFGAAGLSDVQIVGQAVALQLLP